MQIDVINKIKEVAAVVFPNKEGIVLLYGSRARGDNNKNSDWDLLIITQETISTQEKFDKYISPFSEIGWILEENIVPINYSKTEWKSQSHGLFYKNVMADSITIWA